MSNKKSFYDTGGVLKDVHDLTSNSLRVVNVNREIPSQYDKSVITYENSSVKRIKFYRGLTSQKTEIKIKPDLLGSLNSKYFKLFLENETIVPYFSLDGSGVDPNLPNTTSLEISYQEGDSGIVIAQLLANELNLLAGFNATRFGLLVIAENVEKVEVSDAVDVNTGFDLTTRRRGSSKLLKVLDIPQNNDIRYLFNEYEKKIEVLPKPGIKASAGDAIAISGHENRLVVKQSVDKTKAQLSTSTFTQIFSYTTTTISYFRLFKIKVDTSGLLRIKVAGGIEDYYRVSTYDPNGRLEFIEDLVVDAGQEVILEFRPDSLNLENYNFFTRAEGYQ